MCSGTNICWFNLGLCSFGSYSSCRGTLNKYREGVKDMDALGVIISFAIFGVLAAGVGGIFAIYTKQD